MEFKLPGGFNGVRIFSSEILDGPMDKGNIKENLPKFLKNNSLLSTLAYSEQIHNRKIKLIKTPGYYKGCDGLLTGERIILAVKSADCIPLFFFDNERGTTGALHVGRRSLLSGIISVSLKECFEKSSLSPFGVKFFIGPHIRVKNYEVRKDVVDELRGGRFERFLKRDNNDIYFDLTEALESELEELHVKRENIIDSNIDTFENECFFSYRRGDRDKLFISLISWLPKKQF